MPSKYISRFFIFLTVLLAIVYVHKSVALAVTEATSMQNAYEYSKSMNEIRNMDLNRGEKIDKLLEEQNNYNKTLKKRRLMTTKELKSKYHDIDPQLAKKTADAINLTELTRTRFSIATEGLLSIIKKINNNLDERENFGFNVKAYVREMESIEEMLLAANADSEEIVFRLPEDDSITRDYVVSELKRTQQAGISTQEFFTAIKGKIINLIDNIENGQ